MTRRRLISPRAAAAALVLFPSLLPAGAAAAIADNSVRSRSIKDGEVKSVDLGNGAVTRRKIAKQAVDGSKVADDSLGGEQINEALLDFNVLQRRVARFCPDGQVIQGIDPNGLPKCVPLPVIPASAPAVAPDPPEWSQIKNVPAGFADGVDDVGMTSIEPGTIGTDQLADKSVTSAKIQDGGVARADLAPCDKDLYILRFLQGNWICSPDSPISSAGGVLSGSYSNLKLDDAVVKPENLFAGCQDLEILKQINGAFACAADETGGAGSGASGPAGGALTGTFPNPQIRDDVIGSYECEDGLDEFCLKQQPEDAIIDGTVDKEDLGPDAVDSSKIVDGSISTTDLGLQSVTSSRIAWDAVDKDQIAAGAVGHDETTSNFADEIADFSVDSRDLTDKAVRRRQLHPGAVPVPHEAERSVTQCRVEPNTTGVCLSLTVDTPTDSLTSTRFAAMVNVHGYSRVATTPPDGWIRHDCWVRSTVDTSGFDLHKLSYDNFNGSGSLPMVGLSIADMVTVKGLGDTVELRCFNRGTSPVDFRSLQMTVLVLPVEQP